MLMQARVRALVNPVQAPQRLKAYLALMLALAPHGFILLINPSG